MNTYYMHAMSRHHSYRNVCYLLSQASSCRSQMSVLQEKNSELLMCLDRAAFT